LDLFFVDLSKVRIEEEEVLKAAVKAHRVAFKAHKVAFKVVQPLKVAQPLKVVHPL